MQAEVLYLSSWQCPGGRIPDMAAIKANGAVGVIIKPSQGTEYVNKYFKPCSDAALEAGLMLGASPYAQPSINDASDEAQLCLQTIAGYELDLGLWLDWDDPEPLNGMDAAAWCQEWFNAVAGRSVIEGIYIDQNQLNRVPGVPWGHKLWAADTLANPPVTPFIQFVRESTYPGIEGLVCVQMITNIRGLNPASAGVIPYIGKVYNMNDLQQGDTGDQVKVLQMVLNKHGQNLVIDGIFGPLTAGATSAVSAQLGLGDVATANAAFWAKVLV